MSQGLAAVRDFDPVYVRVGSNCDMAAGVSHVRSFPRIADIASASAMSLMCQEPTLPA